MGGQRLYRELVRLYPRRFRHEYGDDLVQNFADLVADRGGRAAWARAGLDLAITVPRYHLEQIMNDRHGTTALSILIALLVAGGLSTLFIGAVLSPLLLVAAGALAITQRSALAKALRTPDTARRHRRLLIAAVLGATFIVSTVVYLLTVGDTWSVTDTVLALVGTAAMFGAGGFLVAGLATPRTPSPG